MALEVKDLEAQAETEVRKEVLNLISNERDRQIKLGKTENQAWASWLMVFLDYSGRVAEVLWRMTVGKEDSVDTIISAIVKALAVGTAWLENILIYTENIGSSEVVVEELPDGELEKTEG